MTERAAWPPPVSPAADQPGPPPGAARRSHPVARGFGAAVGWPATALAALGLLLRELDTGHQSLIVLASAAYLIAPFGLLGLGLHLWRRAWVAVVVGAVVVAVQVVAYAPVSVATSAPPAAATVRVLTQNLLYGSADAERLVQRVRGSSVDVFVAQELTPDAVVALRTAGLDDLLPHAVLDARPESAGVGIWSRYPLTEIGRYATSALVPGLAATVDLPGGVDLTAATLHPAAPFPADPAQWYRDLGRIRAILADLPSGPVFVGGDFNATLDHARFRKLLVDGWHDGAEQAGAGWLRTWPSNRGVPALVGIDHVLTRGTVATSVRPVPGPGSDHDGLLATVVVPR